MIELLKLDNPKKQIVTIGKNPKNIPLVIPVYSIIFTEITETEIATTTAIEINFILIPMDIMLVANSDDLERNWKL